MVHLLENAHWQVGILPQTGGATAFARVKQSDVWVDVMRPTAEADYDNPSNCANFPLIPWSNRIRDGVLRFADDTYQLKTSSDGTARHGVVRHLSLEIVSSDEAALHLRFDSRQHEFVNFPFAFVADLTYRLDGTTFAYTIILTNTDSRPFPAGFGHHPYFVREIDGADAQIEIPCDKMFVLTDGMADSAPVPITPEVDFRTARETGDTHIDALLTEKANDHPIRLIYSNFELHLQSDPIFEHIVMFSPQDKPFYAVEPVTNANDGFNLFAQGIAGSGVFVLQPEESQTGVFAINLAT